MDLSFGKINIHPVQSALQTFNKNCLAFEAQLNTQLIQAKQLNSPTLEVLQKLKDQWQTDRQAHLGKLKHSIAEFVGTVNTSIQIFSRSAIDIQWPNTFSGVLKLFQNGKKNSEPVSKSQPNNRTPTASYCIASLQSVCTTRHELKSYPDLFSPAQVSIECIDANQQWIVTGGWDGQVSVLKNLSPDYPLIVSQQVIADCPIKTIRLCQHTMYVHDGSKMLSILKLQGEKLVLLKQIQIGCGYSLCSQLNYNKAHSLVTALQNQFRLISLQTGQCISLKHNSTTVNSSICGYDGDSKTLISTDTTLLVCNNQKFSLQATIELPHKIQTMLSLAPSFLLSAEGNNVYFEEISIKENPNTKQLARFDVGQPIRLCKDVSNNKAYVIAADKVFIFETPYTKLIEIQGADQLFEFGVTDLTEINAKVFAVGRDDKIQMKTFSIIPNSAT